MRTQLDNLTSEGTITTQESLDTSRSAACLAAEDVQMIGKYGRMGSSG